MPIAARDSTGQHYKSDPQCPYPARGEREDGGGWREAGHIIASPGHTVAGGPMKTFEPRLRAAVPDDWFAKESLTFVAPDGRANVIASSEPLDPSIDTEKYAHVQGEILTDEFPGFHEFSFDPTPVFGAGTGYVRRFQWTPPDGEMVTQVQIYFAENGRGYTATATVPSDDYERYEVAILEVLSRLRLMDAHA